LAYKLKAMPQLTVIEDRELRRKREREKREQELQRSQEKGIGLDCLNSNVLSVSNEFGSFLDTKQTPSKTSSLQNFRRVPFFSKINGGCNNIKLSVPWLYSYHKRFTPLPEPEVDSVEKILERMTVQSVSLSPVVSELDFPSLENLSINLKDLNILKPKETKEVASSEKLQFCSLETRNTSDIDRITSDSRSICNYIKANSNYKNYDRNNNSNDNSNVNNIANNTRSFDSKNSVAQTPLSIACDSSPPHVLSKILEKSEKRKYIDEPAGPLYSTKNKDSSETSSLGKEGTKAREVSELPPQAHLQNTQKNDFLCNDVQAKKVLNTPIQLSPSVYSDFLTEVDCSDDKIDLDGKRVKNDKKRRTLYTVTIPADRLQHLIKLFEKQESGLTLIDQARAGTMTLDSAKGSPSGMGIIDAPPNVVNRTHSASSESTTKSEVTDIRNRIPEQTCRERVDSTSDRHPSLYREIAFNETSNEPPKFSRRSEPKRPHVSEDYEKTCHPDGRPKNNGEKHRDRRKELERGRSKERIPRLRRTSRPLSEDTARDDKRRASAVPSIKRDRSRGSRLDNYRSKGKEKDREYFLSSSELAKADRFSLQKRQNLKDPLSHSLLARCQHPSAEVEPSSYYSSFARELKHSADDCKIVKEKFYLYFHSLLYFLMQAYATENETDAVVSAESSILSARSIAIRLYESNIVFLEYLSRHLLKALPESSQPQALRSLLLKISSVMNYRIGLLKGFYHRKGLFCQAELKKLIATPAYDSGDSVTLPASSASVLVAYVNESVNFLTSFTSWVKSEEIVSPDFFKATSSKIGPISIQSSPLLVLRHCLHAISFLMD
jgi:hypothetical protein